jgi:hypothetical protein
MATDTTAPMPDPAAQEDINATRDQDINPWSVEGAQDESGQVAAIDYTNLARCDQATFFRLAPFLYFTTH